MSSLISCVSPILEMFDFGCLFADVPVLDEAENAAEPADFFSKAAIRQDVASLFKRTSTAPYIILLLLSIAFVGSLIGQIFAQSPKVFIYTTYHNQVRVSLLFLTHCIPPYILL